MLEFFNFLKKCRIINEVGLSFLKLLCIKLLLICILAIRCKLNIYIERKRERVPSLKTMRILYKLAYLIKWVTLSDI
jgi:hypothetical protein